MPPQAASPREAGSAQASLARRARNVKNFHCLFYHGIVGNLEVRVIYCLIFHGIVRNLEVQNLHYFLYNGIVQNSEVRFSHTFSFYNDSNPNPPNFRQSRNLPNMPGFADVCPGV
jgi:hypothetical protein